MLLLCLQHGYLPLHAYLATHECPSAEAVKTLLAAYPDAAQTADDVRCSPSCVIFCASGSHRLVPTACSLQTGCLPLHLALKQPDVGVLAVQALIDAHREAVGFANGEVCVCVCVCVWWWWCHVGAVRGSQHVWQGLTPLHLALKHVTTDALDVVSLLVFVDKSTVGLSGPVRMGGGLRLLVWPPTHVLATRTCAERLDSDAFCSAERRARSR